MTRSLALLGGLSIPVFSSANNVNTTIAARDNDAFFVAESGMLGYDDHFFLGGIYAPGNIGKYESEITSFRQTHKYRSIISFRSSDQYKLAICKDLLDWFFQQNELVFWVGNFPSQHKRGVADAASGWQVSLEKCQHYQTLTAKQAASKRCEVKSKMTSAYGPSPYFSAAFQAQTGMAYQAIDTRASQLIQLADLMLGCVVATAHGQLANPVKVEIVTHLQQLLGGTIPTSNYTHPRFRAL